MFLFQPQLRHTVPSLYTFLLNCGLCMLSIVISVAFAITIVTTSAVALESEIKSPPTGVSLFDQLFGRPTPVGIEYEVPYPFEAFISVLRKRLPTTPDQRSQSYSTVLIPVGRSLTRATARPEYFRYPRIVLAVNIQPDHRYLTKDRLFIGYQEKAEQIEVISYNELSGRFEFQVVENYALGRMPIVKYANRTLCMSCHQNGAAIFPRFNWSETNFDRQIAKRISSYNSHYHGIGTGSIHGDAGRIDAATDRSNLFSTYQQVWQHGCAVPNDRLSGLGCRAAVFQAMLLYRMGVSFVAHDSTIQPGQSYRKLIVENWSTHWPSGIPVPGSDIPDRQPPAHLSEDVLPPHLDPLSIRAPLTYWNEINDVDRSIKGLGDTFLLKADIERLDRQLQLRSLASQSTTKNYIDDCKITPTKGSHGETWIDIECAVSIGGADDTDLVAELLVDETGRVRRGLSWLLLIGEKRYDYAKLSGTIEHRGEMRTVAKLSLTRPNENIRARTREGAAMVSVEFSWNSDTANVIEMGVGYEGTVVLKLSRDLERVERAIAELLEDSESGLFNGFGQHPIYGVELMSALFDKLEIIYPQPSFQNSNAAGSSKGTTVSNAAEPTFSGYPTLELFAQYCGSCHRSSARVPPAFLAGDLGQVTTNLQNCAARIGFRLAMWQQQADSRSISPMPPPTFLSKSSIDIDQWPESADYNALLEYIESLGGVIPNDVSSPVNYLKLVSCLPG